MNELSMQHERNRLEAIKEFQQRLVLFHHSSNCDFTNKGVSCRYFTQCAETAKLLGHLKDCSAMDGLCPQLHCTTSKYLMHHWQSCCKVPCSICKPLRDVVSRKRERASNIISSFRSLKRKRNDDDCASLSTNCSSDNISALSSLSSEVVNRTPSVPRSYSLSQFDFDFFSKLWI